MAITPERHPFWGTEPGGRAADTAGGPALLGLRRRGRTSTSRRTRPIPAIHYGRSGGTARRLIRANRGSVDRGALECHRPGSQRDPLHVTGQRPCVVEDLVQRPLAPL